MEYDFQTFQRAFGRHLRDPHHTPRPDGVPARRMSAYNELLFNNLCGFVDACFPVTRELLGLVRWRRLNRSFYRDWPLQSPWFREIPQAFVSYIQESQERLRLPRYLPDLLHYEWAELAVDTLSVSIPEHDPAGDLMAGYPLLNPALMNLKYNWPVHTISTFHRPRKPKPTYLMVFRDKQDAVQFMETNASTARLIELLDQGHLTGEQALLQVAKELQHPDTSLLLDYGRGLLRQWCSQSVILGCR